MACTSVLHYKSVKSHVAESLGESAEKHSFSNLTLLYYLGGACGILNLLYSTTPTQRNNNKLYISLQSDEQRSLHYINLMLEFIAYFKICWHSTSDFLCFFFFGIGRNHGLLLQQCSGFIWYQGSSPGIPHAKLEL